MDLFSVVKRLPASGLAAWMRTEAAGGGVQGIPSLRELMPAAVAELRRARRYERPLSVLVLAPVLPGTQPAGNGAGPGGASGAASPASPAASRHVVHLLIGSFLRGALRETDLLISAPEEVEHIVIAPECGATGAAQAASRLAGAVQHHTSIVLRAGVAEFPADGFTIEDLVANARDAWRLRSVPVAAAEPVKEPRRSYD